MATKLKNMHLTSVDLVRAGANQEADICLFKSADPQEAAEGPTDAQTNILKRFLAWLFENPAEPPSEPENPIEKADDQPTADIYKSAITESLQSIAADDTLTQEEKNSLIEKSIGQYHDAMVDLFKSDEGYSFEDMEKSFDEEGTWDEEDPEEVEKADRYDEIEEL